MRYSKQREIILKALKDNPVHPTADYLYGLLKKDNPALSLGTVYRNLNLLADNGTIKKIKGVDSKERFDHNTFEHCHIKCEYCGALEDIMLPPAMSRQLTEIKQKSDFDVHSCDILMRGVCKNCKKGN